MKRTISAAVSLLLALAISACGAASHAPSTASQAPHTTTTRATTSATTTSTSAAATHKQLHFQLTDATGWHYTAALPLPSSTTVTVSQNIASSPPGQAQLQLQYATTPNIAGTTVSDDNPGRPGGPQLQLGTIVVDYPLPDTLTNKLVADITNADDPPDLTIGGCSFVPPWQGFWPHAGNGLFCSPSTGQGTLAGNLPESDIALVKRDLQGVRPYYGIDAYPPAADFDYASCNLLVAPNDSVQVSPSFGRAGCGKLATPSVS